jgi:PEP-CTERM motif-containing protein
MVLAVALQAPHASAPTCTTDVFINEQTPGRGLDGGEATPSPTPEPTTMLLFASGLAIGLRKFRQQSGPSL